MAAGRVLQSIIVKKSHPQARTRRGAAAVVRRRGARTYTSRETATSWRFRQRPPSCFVPGRYKTFCLPGEKICNVYGSLKPGAKKRKACR